jgi:hypothetical protein
MLPFIFLCDRLLLFFAKKPKDFSNKELKSVINLKKYIERKCLSYEVN